jgi:Rod binding domain-containing protein
MNIGTSSLPTLNVQMPQKDIQAPLSKNAKDVHAAAVKFESMFMNEMLSHMNEGIKTNEEFGGGHGEDVFRSMLNEQYGKIVADSGQTGLSHEIEKTMLKMQEEQANPRSKAGANAAFSSGTLPAMKK